MFTVASNVGSSMSAATGRSTQGHLRWAANQGAWWCFYLTSTQGISGLYSTNSGSSWSTPTYASSGGMTISGSSFTLATAHGSEGRYFGFSYNNIASTDVLHMQEHGYASRFTLGTIFNNTNSESLVAAPHNFGEMVVLDGNNLPIVNGSLSSWSGAAWRGTADSGTSWTNGFTQFNYYNTATWSSSFAAFPLASGGSIMIADNSSTASTFTNLEFTTWSGSTYPTASTVLGSAVTAADTNAWGAVGRTTGDIHVVALSNNSNTYIHYRYNGSSWSAGDTIGSLTYGTNSGVALVTDGTSVWAFVIDSGGNVQYNKWTSGGSPTPWAGWTQLEASDSNGRAYIVGAYSAAAGQIMAIWTENTGSNYDIRGSILSTSGGGSSGGLSFVQIAEQEFPLSACEEW